MSQAQLPPGMGRCAACKQAQPFSVQVCGICQARLPWAVAIVPPPLPIRPTVTPTASRSTTFTTAAIVAGVILGAICFFSLALFVGLPLLNGTANVASDPGNTASIQNAAPAVVSSASASSGCPHADVTECAWNEAFQRAIAPIDLDTLRGETPQQGFDRRSRQAFQVKVNLRALPPTPPRYNAVLALTFQGMDQYDAANQTAKRAIDSQSEYLARQALDQFDETAATFREMGRQLRRLN